MIGEEELAEDNKINFLAGLTGLTGLTLNCSLQKVPNSNHFYREVIIGSNFRRLEFTFY